MLTLSALAVLAIANSTPLTVSDGDNATSLRIVFFPFNHLRAGPVSARDLDLVSI